MTNLDNNEISAQLKENDDTSKLSFDGFNLKSEILSSIKKMGFKVPTPVQARCYERSMDGGDAIIMAQTGTGKTAAFGLPIVQKIKSDNSGVSAIVLVPTRELALQVAKEISAIGSVLGVKCVPIYGGASFSAQVAQLDDGAAVVVGTPGRTLDHIRRGTMNLEGIETLVLDEADEMLSMGFERELADIMENLPKSRQTLLFSATMPDDIKRLSGKYMNDAVTISVSGDHIGASRISHFVYLVSGLGRVKDLIKVVELERPGSAIIFCNTKDETQFVAAGLKQEGYNAAHISSDLSQIEREKVMTATRDGKIKFLVATDVAARGIDISHLSHVINFSFPESLEKYIHRTGRTGRQGRHGAAISLISPQDIGNLYMLRLTYKIFPVEKEIPTASQLEAKGELDSMDNLVKDFKGSLVESSFLSLADRVLCSVDSRHIVGSLLQGYLTGKIKINKIDVGQPSNVNIKSEKAVFNENNKKFKKKHKNSNRLKDNRALGDNRDSKEKKSDVIGGGKEDRKIKKSINRKDNRAVNTYDTVNKKVESGESFKNGAEVKADAKLNKSLNFSEYSEYNNDFSDAKGHFDNKEDIHNNDKPDSVESSFSQVAVSGKSDAGVKPLDIPDVEQIIKDRRSIMPDMSNPDGFTDIYVDAGRKDGLRISALMKDIVEKSGLPRGDIGKVRMLSRSTFLSVPNKYCEDIFNVITSLDVDGRRLKAEYTEES